MKRAPRSRVVPRRVQDEFRRLANVNHPLIGDIAYQLGLRYSEAQELFRHFRAISGKNPAVDNRYEYHGEREWLSAVLCATCGAPTIHTLGGDCRACFLDADKPDCWKARDLMRTDKQPFSKSANELLADAKRELKPDARPFFEEEIAADREDADAIAARLMTPEHPPPTPHGIGLEVFLLPGHHDHAPQVHGHSTRQAAEHGGRRRGGKTIGGNE